MITAGKYILIFLSYILFLSATENSNNLKPSKAVDAKPASKNISAENLHNNGAIYAQNLSEAFDGINIKSKNRITTLRYSPNYFHIDESGETLWNGKFWPVQYYPLKIYIEKCHSSYYKKRYEKYIDYALQLWQEADSRLKFKYVDYPDQADIIIHFEENLMEKYSQNFLGLTEYEVYDDKSIRLSIVQISFLNFDTKRITDGEIKATIIHELGHALGLGHSENSIDIMFPFIDPHSKTDMKYNELSKGDVSAIKSVIDLGKYKPYSTTLAEPSF